MLVVMGIAAGLALPQLAGLFSREAEKSAARQLAGLLRQARTEAILTGRPWLVTLDWSRAQARLEPAPEPALPRPAGHDGRKSAERSKAATAQDGTGSLRDGTATARSATGRPPTTIADKTRPRLAITPEGRVSQPERLRLVVAPAGLCQPAFVRLSAAGGAETAVEVEPVGCRIALLDADLDAAQNRFEKALGLIDPPWAGAARPGGAP